MSTTRSSSRRRTRAHSEPSEQLPDSDLSISCAGFAQPFGPTDQPGPGSAVFSLVRTTDLAPDDFMDRSFVTGDEQELGD